MIGEETPWEINKLCKLPKTGSPGGQGTATEKQPTQPARSEIHGGPHYTACVGDPRGIMFFFRVK